MTQLLHKIGFVSPLKAPAHITNIRTVKFKTVRALFNIADSRTPYASTTKTKKWFIKCNVDLLNACQSYIDHEKA